MSATATEGARIGEACAAAVAARLSNPDSRGIA